MDEEGATTSHPLILPNAESGKDDFKPCIYDNFEDVERVMEEQLSGYTIHARARRERVLEMLNNYDSLAYAALATNQSMETIKFKLLRLLSPLAEDSPDAEAEHLERITRGPVTQDD